MKTETESKINFNKNEAESKKENPTQSETNVVLQLIKESQIKSKAVMSLSSLRNKEDIFCAVYFVRRKVF